MTRDAGRSGTAKAEAGREPLWVWPACSGTAALVAAVALTEVRPQPGSALATLWPGDAASASSLLQSVTTASITVTTLTFTLTVVALQLASQQFSPRLLRDFTRDRVTKTVLAVFVATFVFALVSLRGMDAAEQVPTLSTTVAVVLALASLAALLGFITHILRVLRVDTMMLAVHDEADRAVHMFYAPLGESQQRSPDELALDDSLGRTVTVRKSGFVQRVDVAALVRGAAAHDAVVRVETRPGDHVVLGTPMATVWAAGGATPPDDDLVHALADVVAETVVVGYERTVEQDAAFGFRQLEDIAVKAVSPGVNDPVTAAHAVGHMSDLLVKLAGRRLGPTLHLDDDGRGRAVVPDRDMDYYLDLACGQLRRFGSAEPTVLNALLRMLRDLATAVRSDDHARAVREAAGWVVEELDPTLVQADADAVHELHKRVLAVLDGDGHRAFLDRSGETRSV